MSDKQDKLDAIFDAQVKFRTILGGGADAIIDNMTEQEKGERLMGLIHAMEDELAELKATVYWKWWAKEGKDPDKKYTFRNDAKMPQGRENAKEELADILCFLGDMCACVGLGPDELTAINLRKTQVNIDRQLNNYSMANKDGKDSEALWNQIKNGELSGKPKVNESELLDLTKLQKLVESINESGGMPHGQDGEPKYMSEQPDKVSIFKLTPTGPDEQFSVTLSSTNETKEITLTLDEKMNNVNPRNILMRKISEAFQLTKPFQIEET